MADTEATNVVASAPVAVFKKRTKPANSVTNARKRPATPPPEDSTRKDSDDSDGSDSSFEEDNGIENNRHVKRPRKAGHGVLKASSRATDTTQRSGLDAVTNENMSKSTLYTADTSAQIKKSEDATKQSNWYDQVENADDLSPAKLLGTTRPMPDANATQSQQPAKKSAGPMKAPANVRTVTITDMSPDVCKDYKQTGYCGFGDSCKFLHMREDYKAGWQLDQDWEKNRAKGGTDSGTVVASRRHGLDEDEKGNGAGDDNSEEAKLLESIPFKCIICKSDYKNPIVTRCNHYFCETCALKRYRKTPNCAQCGQGTGGMFNGAKKLKELLQKKEEREKRKKEKEEEANDGAR